MIIIIALIIVLVIIVVVVTSIQQHKAKLEKEKRAKVAKQKAIIDETEELLLSLTHLPPNPVIVTILNKRSLTAAKTIQQLMPEAKGIKSRVNEMSSRFEASKELAAQDTSSHGHDEPFVLPDNEQQLIGILQCIKKIRATLKSEQTKGALDAQIFMVQDKQFDALQLTIGVESLLKRGNQAYSKEMLGSARQYFEKALQTITDHPQSSDYAQAKKAEIETKLEQITSELKSTNAEDRAKKAKDEEDDLDMLFQPKKKW